MSIEKAIKRLKEQKQEYLEGWVDYDGTIEAYDMAINALEAIQELRSIDDSDKSIQSPEFWDGWYKAIGIINQHFL